MKQDNGEQQLSKWTQQLHDKLAEHEIAAPDDLWAGIEAALAQQPEAPLAQKPTATPSRSRFVTMRRWAVAASIAMLLFSGGYLWLKEKPSSSTQEKSTLAQVTHSHQRTEEKAETYSAPIQESEEISEDVIQTPPQTPIPLVPTKVDEVIMADDSESAITTEPQIDKDEQEKQLAGAPQRQTTDETMRQTSEDTHRQMAEWPQRPSTELSATRLKPKMSLGLYAMNGLDNQSSSNGVLMADALAEQYMNTYANSYSGARRNEPIYLSGYEERQHHHRPITYGLTLSYPLSDRISLTSGVVYTKLQSEFYQTMRHQQIQQEQTLHYIGIPLNLSYSLFAYHRFKTYLSVGGKADWNVAARLDTEGVSQTMPKDRIQWSLNASMGAQYDVLPQWGLYVEPSMDWHPDNGSRIRNYYKDKPLGFGLQIGIRLTVRQ